MPRCKSPTRSSSYRREKPRCRPCSMENCAAVPIFQMRIFRLDRIQSGHTVLERHDSPQLSCIMHKIPRRTLCKIVKINNLSRMENSPCTRRRDEWRPFYKRKKISLAHFHLVFHFLVTLFAHNIHLIAQSLALLFFLPSLVRF